MGVGQQVQQAVGSADPNRIQSKQVSTAMYVCMYGELAQSKQLSGAAATSELFASVCFCSQLRLHAFRGQAPPRLCRYPPNPSAVAGLSFLFDVSCNYLHTHVLPASGFRAAVTKYIHPPDPDAARTSGSSCPSGRYNQG